MPLLYRRGKVIVLPCTRSCFSAPLCDSSQTISCPACRHACARAESIVTCASAPFTGVADDVNQQPGNRIRVQRVDMPNRLSRHFAAVFQFPGRSRGMLSDDLVLAVFQFGVGTLQRPNCACLRVLPGRYRSAIPSHARTGTGSTPAGTAIASGTSGADSLPWNVFLRLAQPTEAHGEEPELPSAHADYSLPVAERIA